MYGRLYSFEGGEGCGKSTQISLLKKYIESQNLNEKVIFLREPGGTEISEDIRHILKKDYSIATCSKTELLLFLAARAQICEEVIAPALKQGKTVIIDRYYDSTIAYQGYGRGGDVEKIKALNAFAVASLPKPDKTFYFDIDPVTAFERKKGDILDRIEKAGLTFHRRVRKGFLKLAKEEPNRFIVLDATKTRQEIFEEIIKQLNLEE